MDIGIIRKLFFCTSDNAELNNRRVYVKKSILVVAVFLLFLCNRLNAHSSLLHLSDGNNTTEVSLGFITPGSSSGENLRADIRLERNTGFYNVAVGMESSDKCLSFLVNGGVCWNATKHIGLGVNLVYNPLFMFDLMVEQNIVPSATFIVNFTEKSKFEIAVGFLYKTSRFFSLPDEHSRIHNFSMSFSIYYKHIINKLSLFAGLSSHSMYSYRLFMQPLWFLGAEYAINDRLSVSVDVAVQYGDLLLSAYLDSISTDISCKYKF